MHSLILGHVCMYGIKLDMQITCDEDRISSSSLFIRAFTVVSEVPQSWCSELMKRKNPTHPTHICQSLIRCQHDAYLRHACPKWLVLDCVQELCCVIVDWCVCVPLVRFSWVMQPNTLEHLNVPYICACMCDCVYMCAL
jgi:hypothetical protein